MASELPNDAPEPRLCHLVKWPDFDGYGFNLHAEKAKTGQFIGKVDDDSPADHAGLKEGDRIVEVNGVNIANENHRQVVERIKAVPNETRLLVLDDEADRWYKERKLIVKSTQPNVNYVKTPVPRPSGGVLKEELQVVKPKAENNNSGPQHSNGNASPPHSETHSLLPAYYLPKPRLCHLVKWRDFDGYGFHLRTEKAKTASQVITEVEEDSPAQHAGLKQGDRIIEVNGINITKDNPRQVIERIKADPRETWLLVVDQETDRWYKERKILVKSTLANVVYKRTPDKRPSKDIEKNSLSDPKYSTEVNSNSKGSATFSKDHYLADSSSRGSTPKTLPKRDDSSVSSGRSSAASSPQPPTSAHAQQNGVANNGGGGSVHSATPPPVAKTESVKTKAVTNGAGKATSNGNKVDAAANGKATVVDAPDAADAKNGKVPADGAKSAKPAASGELNLNMSAAQMREMLANRKKNDPKKQTMDMREKYQIVQQM